MIEKGTNVRNVDALTSFFISQQYPKAHLYGKVTHVEGDDISLLDEIKPNVVDKGRLVYYDKGAGRHFILHEELFELVL